MSRLDELIKTLCPDGVEYKRLSEFATISRGGNFQKKHFCEVGIPCIHYGQIYTKYGLFADKALTFIDEEIAAKQKMAQSGDVIMAVTSENIDDVCKCVAWLGSQAVAVSGHTAIIHHSIDPKYLTYFFHSSHFYAQKVKLVHGTKVMEVTPDHLNKVNVPVPPLEVQREIVCILDHFAEATDALKAELSAELKGRKAQYEHYRDQLITSMRDSYPSKRISEIGTLTRGKRFVHADSVELGIPCIHYGELYTHYGVWTTNTKSHVRTEIGNKLRYAEKNDVVIVGAGENDEDIGIAVAYLGGERVAIHDACYYLHHDQNPKYISYCLRTRDYHKQIKKYVSRGKICAISLDNIGKATIPIPPIAEQNRIAEILDEFDSLCTSISASIPAEIEARQKQYEYYRDKLLTFEEKKEA